jgi:hypothetical protein
MCPSGPRQAGKTSVEDATGYVYFLKDHRLHFFKEALYNIALDKYSVPVKWKEKACKNN